MEEEKKYKKVSYWSVVWSQFKKNKIALWGLGAIVLLLLQAIYSPFLSLDVPIL
ncbi:ABC transporter permease, partial [bacterium]|nr:ABC transporter permease [bacterium]